MIDYVESLVCTATGAAAIQSTEAIQSLWSGYGSIVRCHLRHVRNNGPASVVVKHVRPPSSANHPRGWNTDRSHQRKLRSYQVETAWYRDWSSKCDEGCRVPGLITLDTRDDDVFIVLEDLDASGFDERRSVASSQDIRACIRWLARFHATFLGENPAGLWRTGTYWHLDTRPDELEQLDDAALKHAAPAIDQRLASAPFQTFVHGDAKLANFCFGPGSRVAAVDFQYVGGGCGMKDLAYFLSSCLDEAACEQHEAALLDAYFEALEKALKTRNKPVDFEALHRSWRALYPVAWTDFFRFLQGWSPGHWKIHRYSKRLAGEVLRQL